jgi:hypothetical protein
VAAVEDVSPAAERPLAGPLAEALARDRAAYNARFVMAKRATPSLDERDVLAALRSLDPAVRAAHRCDPAAVDGVASALFDAAISLVAAGVFGPRSRRPEVGAGWRGLLEDVPRLVCADPRRVAAAAGNGLCQLAACAGARLDEWVGAMAAVGALTTDVAAWLEAGKVAAWRAGMAHARAGALEACARLPADVAAVALGLEPSAGGAVVARVLDRLGRDRWAFAPVVARDREPAPAIRLIALVGGFRGFGVGPFVAPPRVGMIDGAFVVTDGESAWTLHVDVYGATFTRRASAAGAAHAAGALALGDDGELRLREERRTLSPIARPSSWVSTDDTLVATRAHSHRIAVVGFSGYGS